MKYLLAFVAMGAVDLAYARYFFAAHERRGAASGAWATMIVGLNSIVVLTYVAEPWTIAAAAAGAFVGTWIAVWLKGPLDEREPGKVRVESGTTPEGGP